MKRRNQRMIIIIITLLIFVLILTTAYAALSTTLTPKFVGVTQNALTWNIGFKTGTVSGTASGNTSSITCGSATATATTISGINVSLSNPGDKCSYTFQIQNNGTIGAKISAITPKKPSDASCSTASGSTIVCGNITYKLRVDSATSNTLLAVNDTIAAKSGTTATTKTVVLTAEYSGSSASADDFYQSNFGYTINFTQN